ncbi:MAG: hypothetical protein LUF02_06010 [Erysipelotrichaceae bacterium]|nr:hypothetical protein [Erysipelotrichaceae bacterium]
MKKILLFLCMLCIIGCQNNNVIDDNQVNNNEKQEGDTMNIIIENQSFVLNLYDNETVDALIDILPLDLILQQLNNNEQYVYLDETLPSNASSIEQIQTDAIW